MINLDFEFCVISINRFAFFLLKIPELMPFIKNVFTWLTIISEGFENFAEFCFVVRFTPRKCFVNCSCLLSCMSKHYSYFSELDFSLDSVPAKNQVNFLKLLPVAFSVSSKGNRVRRLTKTSRHHRKCSLQVILLSNHILLSKIIKFISEKTGTFSTHLTPCGNH